MKEGWEKKKLGEVCAVIAGQSPEGKFYNTTGDGMPFYQGKKDFGEKFIQSPTIWTTQYTKIAQKGDILISVRAPVGPINFTNKKICIGRGLAAIRGKGGLNCDFLYYQLLHLRPLITGKQGAVFSSISKIEIEDLPFVYPCLAEQQRIVALLDEAFADIAIAKAHAEKNRHHARELFESHLNIIFTERGEGWEESSLKALTTKIGSGATPKGGQAAYEEQGISLIRSLNVHDMGFSFDRLAYINDEQAQRLSNVEVQPFDLLLNITGASVARCCVVPNAVLPARVNQHVSIIRSNRNKITPRFLHYILISKHYKDQLLQTGIEGGSTRQALTKAEIEKFTVAYPHSLMVQDTIVHIIDEIAAETQRLECLYQQKLEALDELKHSLLHQAFSGNL